MAPIETGSGGGGGGLGSCPIIENERVPGHMVAMGIRMHLHSLPIWWDFAIMFNEAGLCS